MANNGKTKEEELPLYMDQEKTLTLYAAVQNAYAFAPMLSDETDPEKAEGVQKTAEILKEIGKDMEDNLEEFGVDYREIKPTSEQVPGFMQRVIKFMGDR